MNVERILFTEEQVSDRIREVGAEISAKYAGRELKLIGVLKGSVFFLTALAAGGPSLQRSGETVRRYSLSDLQIFRRSAPAWMVAALKTREDRSGENRDTVHTESVDCRPAAERSEKKHRTLEHADQFQLAARILRADLGAHFANSIGDLFFGEQNAFDVHEAATRRPYLNTRS